MSAGNGNGDITEMGMVKLSLMVLLDEYTVSYMHSSMNPYPLVCMFFTLAIIHLAVTLIT